MAIPLHKLRWHDWRRRYAEAVQYREALDAAVAEDAVPQLRTAWATDHAFIGGPGDTPPYTRVGLIDHCAASGNVDVWFEVAAWRPWADTEANEAPLLCWCDGGWLLTTEPPPPFTVVHGDGVGVVWLRAAALTQDTGFSTECRVGNSFLALPPRVQLAMLRVDPTTSPAYAAVLSAALRWLDVYEGLTKKD